MSFYRSFCSIFQSWIKGAALPLNSYDKLGNYELMMNDCKVANSLLYDLLYKSYVWALYGFVDSLLLNPVWYPLYFSKYQKKLKFVPFEYVKNTFHLNDIVYIQLLKHMPIIRKIIRIFKEYK